MSVNSERLSSFAFEFTVISARYFHNFDNVPKTFSQGRKLNVYKIQFPTVNVSCHISFCKFCRPRNKMYVAALLIYYSIFSRRAQSQRNTICQAFIGLFCTRESSTTYLHFSFSPLFLHSLEYNFHSTPHDNVFRVPSKQIVLFEN